MTGIKWQAAAVILALALGGCGSSPPVNFFDLEALETGYAADARRDLTVGVGPLRTPDYLSRPQIVTRQRDSTVVVDQFNRWLEPVDGAIYRVVAENIDSLIENAVVVSFPYTHISDLDYQLVGHISRFDADEDGTAVLQLQWGVISSREEIVVPLRRARYEAGAAEAQDYAAVAHAMSEVLQQFSRDVARSLEAVISDADD